MKRLLSIIILATLLMSSLTFASYADEAAGENDTIYQNAVTLVSAINTGFSLDADMNKEVTRGEFLMLSLGLYKDCYSLSEHTFTDIPDSLAPLVTHALKLGMIDEGIRFYPDEPINYEQAMRIAVVMTGYTPKALNGGYLVAARSAKLDESLNSDKVTYRNAVVLMANVLNTRVMEQTVYGPDSASYRVSSETFLQMYHGIDTAEGIVKENEYTSLTSSQSFAPKGRITIGVTEFAGGNSEYLGYNVRAYYKRDTKAIVAMYPFDNNELITKDAKLQNDTDLKYYIGNKEYKAKLDSAFKFIYNGKAYTKSGYKNLINKAGVELRLLDYNADNIYDIVFVWDYSYITVNYTDTYNQRIFDIHGNSYLDFSDPTIGYEIFSEYAGGLEKVGFTDIYEGACLTYCLSDDGRYCRIFITEDSITGQFTSVDRSRKIMYIGDAEYKYNSYFEKYYMNTYGTSATFVIAYDGTVVSALANDISGYKYGFLVDAAPYTDGLDSCLYAKIYSQDGKLLTLKSGEKIMIDGTRKDFGTAFTNDISPLLAADDYSKIVRFCVNEKGELSALDIVSVATSLTDIKEPKSTNDSLTRYYQGSYTFKNPPYFFGEKFYMSSSTTIMIIPSDENLRNDERYYTLGSYSSTFNDGSRYTVAAYDINNMGLASLVIQVTGSGTSMQQQRSAVMLGKSVVYYPEDAESKTTYEVYRNGTYRRLTAQTPEIEAKMNSVSPGDIIRLRISGTDEISDVLLDYDLSSDAFGTEGINTDGYVTMFKGYLDAYNGTNMNIVTDKNALTSDDVSLDEYLHMNTSRGDQIHLTVFKNRSGQITSVRPNNLSETSVIGFTDAGQSADWVVVRRRADYPQLAVVYTFVTR